MNQYLPLVCHVVQHMSHLTAIEVVVVSLANHSTRLPLCGTELGMRKSPPPLTSRETKATPINQLYQDALYQVLRSRTRVPSHALRTTLRDWIRSPLLSRRGLDACFFVDCLFYPN